MKIDITVTIDVSRMPVPSDTPLAGKAVLAAILMANLLKEREIVKAVSTAEGFKIDFEECDKIADKIEAMMEGINRN